MHSPSRELFQFLPCVVLGAASANDTIQDFSVCHCILGHYCENGQIVNDESQLGLSCSSAEKFMWIKKDVSFGTRK